MTDQRERPPAADSFVGRILGPRFRETVYGSGRHVVFRRHGAAVSPIMTWEALETVLTTHSLEVPQLRLMREGHLLPEDQYMQTLAGRRGRVRRRPDAGRLTAALLAGYTLMLRHADELHPPLGAVAAAFEDLLKDQFEFNLYASWAPVGGIGPHWDDHDAFVFQLSGAKRWRLFGRSERSLLPRYLEPDPCPAAVEEEVLLEQGDVLYLPRGVWHEPLAVQGQVSLHVTGSVAATTGVQLAEWVIAELARKVTFGQDIPRFAGRTRQAELLAALRGELQAEFERPGLIDRFFAARDAALPGRAGITLPGVRRN